VTIAALSPNGLDRYHGASQPEAVLVATIDGVVELRARAGAWTPVSRELIGCHVSSVLIDGGGRVFAGTHGDGVYQRDADGAWEPCSAGLTERNVYSLAAGTGPDGAVVYAGTEPALFVRLDGESRTWTELDALRTVPGRDGWNFPAAPHVAHAKHVDIDPRDPRTFYVSVEQGALLKTTDGGMTFRQLPFRDATYQFNSDAHRVAINALNPDEIYLTGGDGVTRSADAGESWERVATPSMRIGYPDAAFCSPLEDGVLFAAGAGGRPHSWRATGNAEATIVRSADRGRTWGTLGLGSLRGNIEAVTLVAVPGDFGFFVATTDGEVFASSDRGARWSLIARGLPPISKGGHYQTVRKGRAAV
jgi:hypothetical protein